MVQATQARAGMPVDPHPSTPWTLERNGRVVLRKYDGREPTLAQRRDDRAHTVSSRPVIRTAFALVRDLLCLLRRMCRSRAQLAAENLFLRKQLACYVERRARPHRTDNASRIALVLPSHLLDWRELLTIVRPDTFVRWHREFFRLFWRVKSRPRGRPRIPTDLQQLIVETATANRTWGEERIAAELRLKLGLTVSPRTVRRYRPRHCRPEVASQPNRGPRFSTTMPVRRLPATSSWW